MGEFAPNPGSRVSRRQAKAPVRLPLQWPVNASVANDTLYFLYKAHRPGTIISLDYKTAAGSFTVATKINSTAVTGLSATAVSSATFANALATGANKFAVGDNIAAVITAATVTAAGAMLNLCVVWD